MGEEATLVPRFAGGPYGPGEIVEGVLVARESIPDARTLNAYLRYVDRSPSYSGSVTHDSVEPLHEGPVEAGLQIPFELRIPEDAYPAWDDPSTTDFGSLAWSVVVEAEIAKGLDTITTHDVPVDTGATWKGPAPSEERKLKTYVENWDVEVIPDRWDLRRGEQVTTTLRIGKTKSERPKLEVGVLCQAFYQVEVKQTSGSGDTDYRKETNHVDVFEKWVAIDPSLPEQSFTVGIPEDAPFTYRGTAFGFAWSALAREKRRFYQSDAGRVAVLEVLP